MTDINKKLENIDKKLDLLLEQTFRQDERIKFHNDQIEELKRDTIPNAIKNGNIRVKNWVYAGGVGILLSIIGTIFSLLK